MCFSLTHMLYIYNVLKYDVSMGDEQKREMIYTRKQNIICECVIYKNVYYIEYTKT